MGSKVVVTYKRKRLFSRSDHSPVNLHSDKPCEISESKNLANFIKHEEQIRECVLQNEDGEYETGHKHSENHVGEMVLQVHIQKSSPEQKRLSPSDAKQLKSHPNVNLEGRCRIDSAGQSNAEEKPANTQSELLVISGSEYEDKCKETLNCSNQTKGMPISGTCTLEGTNKVDDDQHSSSCVTLGTKRKLASTLIKFYRRSKRKRDVAAPDTASEYGDMTCVSITQPAASCLIELKNEKDVLSPLQEEACVDGQDNRHSSISSRGMTSTPDTRNHASRDIDCNVPLDCGSDENLLPLPLEVPRDSLGSTGQMKQNTPPLLVQSAEHGSPVRAVSDKGKFIVDSPPRLTSTSTKVNYLQLFPENRTNGVLHLANDTERTSAAHPPTLQCSHANAFYLQPEHTVNGHASYSSLYNWPNIHAQPREPFRDFLQASSYQAQSFSRHQMMLDNLLTRARAVRTNWSEDELDCLWIGVRRHGRGNWDSILRDRGLHFSPWKTPLDLADRWHEEQSRLFYSQKNRQFFQKPGTISRTLPSYGYLGKWGLLTPSVGNPGLRWDESSSNAIVGGGLMKGSLPHWLREAVEIPPRAYYQQPWLNHVFPSVQRRNEPRNGVMAGCTNSPMVTENGKGERRDALVGKPDDLIVIPSDASSEETISDDHSIRP